MDNKPEILKEIEEVLKKNHVKIGYQIDFPRYKELPEEVKLSLLILGNHGMKIQFIIKPQEETT